MNTDLFVPLKLWCLKECILSTDLTLMATSTCQCGFINGAAAVSADLEQPLKIASGTQKGAALHGLHAAKGLLHMGWHNVAAAALQ